MLMYEGTVSTEALQQDSAWHVLGTGKEAVWLKQTKQEKSQSEGVGTHITLGLVGHCKDFGF